jgi:CheY-like chemotaxis protein
MLKEKGYTFDLARNGLEAIEFHKQKEYDVILMDIQMPLMDGLETAKRIREHETDKHTPIIALTAYALQGDREHFLSLGMDGYLPKPIQMGELFYLINEVTSNDKSGTDISKIRVDNDGNIIMGDKAESLFTYDPVAISDIDGALEKLLNSIDINNIEIAGYYANKLKQLCNSIGADDLKSIAFQTELAVRRNNFKDMVKYTSLFKQEYKTFKNIFSIRKE